MSILVIVVGAAVAAVVLSQTTEVQDVLGITSPFVKQTLSEQEEYGYASSGRFIPPTGEHANRLAAVAATGDTLPDADVVMRAFARGQLEQAEADYERMSRHSETIYIPNVDQKPVLMSFVTDKQRTLLTGNSMYAGADAYYYRIPLDNPRYKHHTAPLGELLPEPTTRGPGSTNPWLPGGRFNRKLRGVPALNEPTQRVGDTDYPLM